MRDSRARSSLGVVFLLVVLVGCSTGSQNPLEPTAVVDVTTTPVAAAPTRDLPTAASTITAAPTATAFPLETGWWDDAVCYEVFVRSFYDSNGDGISDLRGLTQKLDYLSDGDDATTADLDVNCLWLMPVADSPSYHGYDVVDYRAIEPDYGTTEDFRALVAAAHDRGMKVIVDLVLNHTSSEHPWFKGALSDPASPRRDWFLWSKDDPGYFGPWGQQVWHPAEGSFYYGIFTDGMPDLNYRNPDVTTDLVVLNFSSNERHAVKVNGEGSDIAPASYQMTPLLGDANGAPLTVGSDGTIDEYVPLPTLAAQTGYVWRLE